MSVKGHFFFAVRVDLTDTDITLQEKGLDKGVCLCYNTQALEGAPQYRGVEQLEARRAHNPEVVGSSPASATTKSTENNLFSVLFLYF